nr:helix-turn-helix domain-containing protein [Ferrovum sp.]
MKSGLSQSAFAKFLGVSVRTLQDWEQGRREPCVFHTKLDGDSTANWTAIPRQSGQEM